MTWPTFVDGVGAMFVRCDNDPIDQLARIHPTPTWVAVKVNGGDITPQAEIVSWINRVHAAHPTILLGVWVYAYGPPAQDVRSWQLFYTSPAFVIYDVEAEYKTDEAGAAVAGWPAELVASHPKGIPAAVTSYGAIPGYGNQPSSIDFGPFVAAGWPMLAQCYDPFHPGDEQTYVKPSGPYPPEGVHQLLRSLVLKPGEAVYRPEGIDS